VSDLRPDLGVPFALFGVPATVTPAGSAAISTSVVWEGQPPVTVSADGELVAGQPRRTMRIRRDQVPALHAHGATILAPPQIGAADETWKVDQVDELNDQEFRAYVFRPRP